MSVITPPRFFDTPQPPYIGSGGARSNNSMSEASSPSVRRRLWRAAPAPNIDELADLRFILFLVFSVAMFPPGSNGSSTKRSINWRLEQEAVAAARPRAGCTALFSLELNANGHSGATGLTSTVAP